MKTRLRSLVSYLLVLVAVAIVGCGGPGDTEPPTYTKDMLDTIELYATPVEIARRRMPELSELIEERRWVDVDTFIHGPYGQLRRDLSFIEKANFARQMRDQGYDRATICAALHSDKTLISRMISVIDRLPPDLVEVIGAAPSAGRDRWLVVADRIEADVLSPEEAIATVNLARDAHSSDARFAALFSALNRRRDAARPAPADRPLRGAEGEPIGKATRRSGATVVTLPDKTAPGFADWLITALPDLHHRWKTGDGG